MSRCDLFTKFAMTQLELPSQPIRIFHVQKNKLRIVQRLINFFSNATAYDNLSYKFSINILSSSRHYKSAVKWKDDVNEGINSFDRITKSNWKFPRSLLFLSSSCEYENNCEIH